MNITKRIFAVIISTTLFAPFQLSTGAQGAENILNRVSIDPTIPQKAPMVYCKTSEQRDCIEKVIVEHPDGTFDEAAYVQTIIVPFPDYQGQKVNYGDVIFDFRSGSRSGSIKRLRISTNVQTPEFVTDGKKWGIYWLMLQRQALPGEVILAPNACDGIDYKTCLSYPALDTEDKFHMYFRTSWLKPVGGGGYGIHTNLQHQKISGGYRWKFSGVELLQPLFNDSSLLRKSITAEGQNLKPDKLNPVLYAVLDHAGISTEDSIWDPKCADYGFTISMSNAPMAGQLYWNYASETLVFNVYAPHLNVFGEPNKGFFFTKFHQSWLNCRFPGNTLSTATRISVQVLNEDGTPQIATTSTSIKNGIIEINATGFHYSSPSIVATRSSDSQISTTNLDSKISDDWDDPFEQPQKADIPKALPLKKQTIKCSNGKNWKRITGSHPICPKGFKRMA